MRLVSLTLLIIIALPLPSWAYEILVVQSQRSPVYDEVMHGFRSSFHASCRILVLSDYTEVDIQRIVRQEHPALILTMGDNALAAAKRARSTPVLALLALTLPRVADHYPNVTGITVPIPPERYAEVFAALKTKRIGVVYDPAVSGAYVRRAAQAIARDGQELITREVHSPREVGQRLASLRGEVDALWLIPDTTALTSQTSEAFFLTSIDDKIPVVAFAGAYIRLGAAVTLEGDRADLGRQASGMAADLLHGITAATHQLAPPRRGQLRINSAVMKWLHIESTPLERLPYGRE